MPPLINLSFLPLLLFTTHLHCTLAAGGGRIFIYSGCSQDKYEPNTPYETNLNSLLSSILTSSHQTLYNTFTTGNDTATPTYGLYQCRGDLNPTDCSKCMATLIAQIELVCPYTAGANLQLDRCFLRYEDWDFSGTVDMGLRYKRCGVSNGGNDFLRRRDDVLGDLSGAVGFRVSVTGAVEGYAQCLGDLGASECLGCLGEATAEVKRLCGAAAAGDLFLAQCYVRYWEAGYYDAPSDSSNQDDVGKTVAIIIGSVAGFAVLIVLLSYCRKALG